MSKTVTTTRDAEMVSSPNPDEIRRELRNILASPAFHGSKRSQQFLEYVCDKSLAGEVACLKERSIAIEVFGRRPQSDLGEDTIVRVSAREVRKRLAQYYVTPEGAAYQIHIDLPAGAYVPEFRYASAHKEAEAPGKLPGRSRLRIVVAGVLLFVLVPGLAWLAVVKWAAVSPNAEAFNRFWEPVFRAPEPLLVAVAHPIVYHPSVRALKLSQASQPSLETAGQRALQVPPNKLDGSDMVPVFNQYVGFGDLVAATDIAAMLSRKSKRVRVRMASSIEFADLRTSQTLLIGAITNRWTMELQPAWRFQFGHTPELKTVLIDTQTAGAARREWSIAAKADGSAQEDYILISRVRNSLTGSLVLVAAGLKQFGTEAAGVLLSDPDQLGSILRKLPAGWDAKNLQIVLHAKVIGNTPAQPEVMAWYVW